MTPLSSHHTFGLNSFCEELLELNDQRDVSRFVAEYSYADVMLIGQGSNTIFTEDYSGKVVHMSVKGVEVIETESDYHLRVNAGEDWHTLVSYCVDKGIDGLENLALIPGTVGAAPIQNIGAYGREICDFIEYVECHEYDSKALLRLTATECNFGYRDSIFKGDLSEKCVITQVGLRIPKCWRAQATYGELAQLEEPTARDIFNKVIEIRKSKLPDPSKIGNAGSFFKNPVISQQDFDLLHSQYPEMPHFNADNHCVKIPAAWLIDRLGFKGKHVGGIQCHPRQALVLTNTGKGTGQELLLLAREIKQAVYEHFSVTLENEVRLVGKEGLISL